MYRYLAIKSNITKLGVIQEPLVITLRTRSLYIILCRLGNCLTPIVTHNGVYYVYS